MLEPAVFDIVSNFERQQALVEACSDWLLVLVLPDEHLTRWRDHHLVKLHLEMSAVDLRQSFCDTGILLLWTRLCRLPHSVKLLLSSHLPELWSLLSHDDFILFLLGWLDLDLKAVEFGPLLNSSQLLLLLLGLYLLVVRLFKVEQFLGC